MTEVLLPFYLSGSYKNREWDDDLYRLEYIEDFFWKRAVAASNELRMTKLELPT
jgi:hypothetical protein